ncbi:MAG: flavin reductase family protein [Clostridia bacterium]|nr:flavin reductase family protein [Clostridia bacterium]NCC74870.1 flavin reductase family protein [Clostridia bacterium]
MDLSQALAPKVELNPSTLLAPVPVVLVSCCGLPGEGYDQANMITVAWAGTINSEPPMVSVSIRPSRYSHTQISQSREFVINLVNDKILKATDFCGVKSGRDLDKFSACKLNAIKASQLQHAPAVAQSPLTLSCQVEQILPLGSHDLFLARVAAVEVSPALLDADNRLRLDKANLVAYAHGNYYSLGRLLGFFGYSVARPQVLAKRMPPSQKKTAHKKGRSRSN